MPPDTMDDLDRRNLADRVRQMPAAAANGTAARDVGACAPPVPFEIVRADALPSTEGPHDFVEGLLTEGAVSVIYGPSNCGKSFWVLDLAAHVATGIPWRDGEVAVDQGAVVYVGLEGSQGLRNRIAAMRQQEILTDGAPFFVCLSPVSLLDPGHASRLTETVKLAADQSDLPCRLVVIDTMSRAMAGGNENAGEDMTAAIASIDAVKLATGAHVAIVHHCGKDEARGARGHSSLRAAVDTEIEIFRPEGEHVSTARVMKQRDLEIGEPMPFSLTVIEMGTDRRGKPITSCVVKHEDAVMASTPKASGRKATYKPEDMLAYLPADNVKQWLDAAKEDCGVSNGKFYELKALLEKRGAIRKEVATGRIIRA